MLYQSLLPRTLTLLGSTARRTWGLPPSSRQLMPLTSQTLFR
jgi:hypothetical protein